jgi:hypothetical protein
MKWWRLALLLGAATVALIVALALAGVGNGLPLLIYVLFVAALLTGWLVGRLRRALPLAPDFERLLSSPVPAETEVEQFEAIRRRLTLARSTRADLLRLQPIVREIAATRLSRRGIDLEREAEKAQALVGGGKLWELIHLGTVVPTGPGDPFDPRAPGWSRAELERLVDELENL